MRIGPGFGLVLLLASAVCAQTRGGGSVVYPGGAGLPGVTRTLGSVVNPAQGGLRAPGSRGGGNNGRTVIAAYPIYVGGYYYAAPYYAGGDPSVAADPSASGQAPSNITVVMPPQQPVTPVVINYNYGSVPPPSPDQGAGRAPANASEDNTVEPSHYLIAFKDHTIYAATAYWVDGDTLHYFTAGNVHNQASLALVDRDFTERLNREAGLDVRLPAASSK
jgi:hypothetical protein